MGYVMEFTSIFHDLVTEEYVEEGKHAPDHPGSPKRLAGEFSSKDDKAKAYRDNKKKFNDSLSAPHETEAGRKRRNDSLIKNREFARSDLKSYQNRELEKRNNEAEKASRLRPGTNGFNKHATKANTHNNRVNNSDEHAVDKLNKHKGKSVKESFLDSIELI